MCSLGALRMPGGPPPARPYLRADPEDVALWAERLAAMAPPTAGVRRVGLVLGTRQVRWNDDGSTNALRKTLPGLSAAGLAEAKDVQWIGLHASETAAMFADVPHLDIVDPSPWISDMADTAAIIETLDLGVSADTAVAHLAGSHGQAGLPHALVEPRLALGHRPPGLRLVPARPPLPPTPPRRLEQRRRGHRQGAGLKMRAAAPALHTSPKARGRGPARSEEEGEGLRRFRRVLTTPQSPPSLQASLRGRNPSPSRGAPRKAPSLSLRERCGRRGPARQGPERA